MRKYAAMGTTTCVKTNAKPTGSSILKASSLANAKAFSELESNVSWKFGESDGIGFLSKILSNIC